MWQTKKFKLVGKIEGKKYYKYDSKKKKFTRDRKSKVVQNAKKKAIFRQDKLIFPIFYEFFLKNS